MQGLIIDGKVIKVPGVHIDNMLTASWARLHPNDCRRRDPDEWIRQVIVHTTKGISPSITLPGIGPSHRDKVVADYWYCEQRSSAAHIVIDSDGTAACLCDLRTTVAYHATSANRWSVGIEVYQHRQINGIGAVYQAALHALVAVCDVLSKELLIPRQIPRWYRKGEPLARFVHDGGSNLAGFFGHRDQTIDRSEGDPSDGVMMALHNARYQRLDFVRGEDLHVWRQRQKAMGINADGLAGPQTMRRWFADQTR